jgi:hypothetical protein
MLLLMALPAVPAVARTIVVNNRATNASDLNPATETRPLKTIQAGANHAQAGDVILVGEGIYR